MLLCGRLSAQCAIRREAQKEHIGARVHGAQGTVNLETVRARLHIEPLRDDRLKNVACGNVFLGAVDRSQKILLCRPEFHLQFALGLLFCQLGQRLGEAFLQLIEPLDSTVVRGRRFQLGHIGRDHQPNFLAHMVECQHLVKEEQAGVGNAQLVFGQFRQALNLAHRVIGKKAHRTGGKRRKPRQTRGLVPSQSPPQHGKDVILGVDDFLAFCDRDLTAARDDPLERSKPYEGVAPHLLAVLDRLQHEAFALRPRSAQKRRDRRFQVGRQRTADGNKRVLFGEREKLFAAGLDGLRRRFHSLSVIVHAVDTP